MLKFAIKPEVRAALERGGAEPEELLGIIPTFLSPFDPRPAAEQIDENYQHGGGWRRFDGFALNDDDSIQYAGEPKLPPLAVATLRDERICYYDSSWVAIIQPDRSYQVSRID